MRTIRSLILVAALMPSLALAGYQNPTVVSNDRQRDGTSRIVFQFLGNAGEPPARRDFVLTKDTTATSLRNWIADRIDELDLLNTAGTLSILQPGQTVPKLARTPVTPTPKQVWLEKFARYMQFKNSGLTAATSALDALKADLEATYQAGFLD